MKQLSDYTLKELIEEFVGIQITNKLEEKLMTSELGIKVLAKRIIYNCVDHDSPRSKIKSDIYDIVNSYNNNIISKDEENFDEQIYNELGVFNYNMFIIVYQELLDMVEITISLKSIENDTPISDLIDAINKLVVILIDSTKDNNVSNCKLEKLVMSIVSLSMSLLIQRKKKEIEITIKLSTIKDIIQLLNDVDKEMITDYEKETIMKFLSYFNS